MKLFPTGLMAIALAALIAGPARAADQTILGSGFQAKNPGDPAKRKVQVKAKENPSGNTIVGNPVVSGATLTIRANGTTPSQQVLALPQGTNAKGKPFWSGDAVKGFKYNDAKFEQGPVKGVKIKKTGGGVFQIQAQLSSKTAAVTVLPPLCSGSVCKCPNQVYTFTVNSNSGGAFDSAEWPGGTANQSAVSGCSVTINRPDTDITLVCALGASYSIHSFSGYSNCFGNGGEDGDGCQPVSCPPLGVGSCCNARPSCSTALNGSAQSQYFVQCLQ